MLLDSLRALFKSKPEVKHIDKGDHYDIHGRLVENAEEYFFPQRLKGIPVFSTDTILHHYRPMIDKLFAHVPIGDHRLTPDNKKVIDVLYREAIERYTEYVHMLPASESHHHSTPGGLFVHSLESATFAYRYAADKKAPSLGWLDKDRTAEPMYHYAVFLGAILHDAGKILRDITVEAVRVYNKQTQMDEPSQGRVGSWQPHKETLIQWATKNNVSTYTAIFNQGRLHGEHNVDSLHLLSPVVGKGYALDFLLSAPENIYGELSKVLSGYSSSRSFIAECVKYGDSSSTAINTNQFSNRYLKNKPIGKGEQILRAFELSRPDWEINVPGREMWNIGGDIYIRYATTFNRIINAAKKADIIIPQDINVIVSIMMDHGLIKPYDEENTMVKFVPGEFSKSEIEEIRTGKKVVTWEPLYALSWPGIAFDAGVLPPAACGLLYLADSEVLIEYDSEGAQEKYSTAKEDIKKETEAANDPIVKDKDADSITNSVNASIESDIEEESTSEVEVKDKTLSLSTTKIEKEESAIKETKGIKFENTSSKYTALESELSDDKSAVTENENADNNLNADPNPGGNKKSDVKQKGKGKKKGLSEESKVLLDVLNTDHLFSEYQGTDVLLAKESAAVFEVTVAELIKQLDSEALIKVDPSTPNKKQHVVKINGKRQGVIYLTEEAYLYLSTSKSPEDTETSIDILDDDYEVQDAPYEDFEAEFDSFFEESLSEHSGEHSTLIDDKDTQEIEDENDDFLDIVGTEDDLFLNAEKAGSSSSLGTENKENSDYASDSVKSQELKMENEMNVVAGGEVGLELVLKRGERGGFLHSLYELKQAGILDKEFDISVKGISFKGYSWLFNKFTKHTSYELKSRTQFNQQVKSVMVDEDSFVLSIDKLGELER